MSRVGISKVEGLWEQMISNVEGLESGRARKQMNLNAGALQEWMVPNVDGFESGRLGK